MKATNLRRFIDETLAHDPQPSWSLPSLLPVVNDTTPYDKKLRQAVLLFALGLPGVVSPDDDHTEYQAIANETKNFSRFWQPVRKVDWLPRMCTLDSLAYIVDGMLICLNLSLAQGMFLTDGSVVLASSDSPFAGYDPTSDNNPLAPATCAWIALK